MIPLTGQLRAGWTLSLGGAGGSAGAAAGDVGLFVPSQESAASALSVTLIDANGVRIVFQLSAAIPAVEVTKPITGALGVMNPKALAPSTGNHLCVDTLFSAPPGVHLNLWRYTQVTSHASTNPCITPDSGTMPGVVGFAIERPDRIRYEINAARTLVGTSDGHDRNFTHAAAASIPVTS